MGTNRAGPQEAVGPMVGGGHMLVRRHRGAVHGAVRPSVSTDLSSVRLQPGFTVVRRRMRMARETTALCRIPFKAPSRVLIRFLPVGQDSYGI